MVKLYSYPDSAEGYQIRDFLNRSVVEYDYVQLHDQTDVVSAGIPENEHLPVIELPDGRRLFNPAIPVLAEYLGFVKPLLDKEYDLSIYGAGPAGLSAAVYAASEGLSVALIEKLAVGGQAGTSSLIENYMGFPKGIRGAMLAENARQQAVKFGAEILLLREGVKGEFHDGHITGYLADGHTIKAKANICATGIEYQRLTVEHESRFLNRGIYYGAGASEASMSKNEHVIVVGGGNSAGQAVLNFSAHAHKVTMLVRGRALAETLSQYLLDRIVSHKKIEVLYQTEIVSLDGNEHLKQITIRSGEHPLKKINTGKVFVCIGGRPNTQWAKDIGIMCKDDYLLTGTDIMKDNRLPDSWPLKRPPFYLETCIPGSFAAGDVRYGSVKRVAAAVGEGAMAVTFVHKYLAEL